MKQYPIIIGVFLDDGLRGIDTRFYRNGDARS